jgi:hypothetical protein
MHSDLFVTSNSECADSISSLAYGFLLKLYSWIEYRHGKHTIDGSLTAQLLEHLCSPSESITRFAHRDVEDELLDAQLLHGVLGLFGFSLCCNVSTCTIS